MGKTFPLDCKAIVCRCYALQPELSTDAPNCFLSNRLSSLRTHLRLA